MIKHILEEYEYLDGTVGDLETIDPVNYHLCGEKNIVIRGKEGSLWTRVENVMQSARGDILFLVCTDGLLIPWDSIEIIKPLGR